MSSSRSIDNKNEEDDLSPFFSILPLEIREKIYAYMSATSLGLFARTSHQAETETILIRLLHCAVNAEPESYEQEDPTKLAAIAILEKHPELLFKKGIVIHHFDRKIKASLYQLFLGVLDIWALKQVFNTIMPQIENSKTHAKVQFKEQFPNCPWPLPEELDEDMLYDDRNKKQVAEVTAQLQVIVTTMAADPCTDGEATLEATKQAIEKWRQIFAPKKSEVIQTGLHFPSIIMIETTRKFILNKHFWSTHQKCFFLYTVINAVQTALTAIDSQICREGLDNLNIEKGPARRKGLFYHRLKDTPQQPITAEEWQSHNRFINPFTGIISYPTSEVDYNFLNSIQWFEWALADCFLFMDDRNDILRDILCKSDLDNNPSPKFS